MTVTPTTAQPSPATGNVRLAPGFSDSGTYGATVTATDNGSPPLTSSRSFTITVNNDDRAPTTTAPATVTVREGDALSIPVTASDPDGDAISALTADLSALPPGNNAVFAPGAGNTSGTLTWSPASGDAGSSPYDVTFTASNALTGSATTAITVSAPNQGSNLVGNPSFETSTSGWVANAGGTIQRVAGGLDGSFSLEVRGSGTGKFGLNDSPNWISETPAAGAVYRFTAWVRSDSAGGVAELQVREYMRTSQKGTTTYSNAVTPAPGWQMMSVDYVARVAGSTLDLQVEDDPIAAGEAFQIDNISASILAGGSSPDAAPDLAAVVAPNPPNPGATLAFTTSRDGPAHVRVYDLAGRCVKILLEAGSLLPGRHAVRFDGRDASGRRLPSGVYFYRIEVREGSAEGRFVLMR